MIKKIFNGILRVLKTDCNPINVYRRFKFVLFNLKHCTVLDIIFLFMIPVLIPPLTIVSLVFSTSVSNVVFALWGLLLNYFVYALLLSTTTTKVKLKKLESELEDIDPEKLSYDEWCDIKKKLLEDIENLDKIP